LFHAIFIYLLCIFYFIQNTLQKENGLIEDPDKIPSMSVTNYNHEDSCFNKINDLQGHDSLEINEHLNLNNFTPDNIKTFRNISQYNACSSDEQNKILSGTLHWNYLCKFFNFFRSMYYFVLFRIYVHVISWVLKMLNKLQISSSECIMLIVSLLWY